LRIVVRCQDAKTARDAQAALAAARVDAAALPGPYRAAPDGEDVAIVVAPSGDIAAAAGLVPADAPTLATLVALPGASPPPNGMRRELNFSGAINLEAPAKLLGAQIEAAIREAIACEERNARAATAAELNVTAPAAAEPRKLKALYIGAPSAMFLSLERALTEQGGLVAAAFSSYAGFDHLHDEPFDAVVLNGAQDAMTAISLCAALRRNASLYHLPTMVVTAPSDDKTVNAALERGAAAVVAANAPYGPSLGWLFEAIRRERSRGAAEHEIRAFRDLMGDPRTGLFKRAPFETHVTRLANNHQASGRPLALALLRVAPAIGAREPSPEAWKRGFNEIASLAGRLIRETDSGAALGADIIALAMPATDARGARRITERVASVAECTAFAAGDGGAGPLVFEQTVGELQPGESGAGLLARVLHAIAPENVQSFAD
jgi:two-component system cell cycle response regulator PopA